jgi:hypothetical protein
VLRDRKTSPFWLKRDDVFAARQYDPPDGDHVHFGNRIANNREGILPNLAIGGSATAVLAEGD